MKRVEERLKEMPFDPEINRLDADEDLRRRILRAAEETEKIPALFRGRRAAAFAAACVLVLALGGSFAYSRLHRGTETPRLLTSQPAGESAADSAVMEAEEAATAAVFAGAERGMLDVKNGTVSISAQSAPAYRSIWASGSGSHYPVIGVNGRYYRMLTSPASVSSSLLGDVLGAVEEYTDEPALSRAGLVSNVVGQGGTVWAVRGMNGSAAAAEVNGVYRVFQRVSYAGSALMGGESFRDTLRCSGVTGMELSGVGTLNGGAAAEMWNLLLSNAVYQGTGCSETGQSLLIYLDNGLILQLSVSGETVQGCGTWICPDFFAAFYNRVGS